MRISRIAAAGLIVLLPGCSQPRSENSARGTIQRDRFDAEWYGLQPCDGELDVWESQVAMFDALFGFKLPKFELRLFDFAENDSSCPTGCWRGNALITDAGISDAVDPWLLSYGYVRRTPAGAALPLLAGGVDYMLSRRPPAVPEFEQPLDTSDPIANSFLDPNASYFPEGYSADTPTILAGSFVRYLFDRGGREKLQMLLAANVATRADAEAAFAAVYGISFSAALEEWRTAWKTRSSLDIQLELLFCNPPALARPPRPQSAPSDPNTLFAWSGAVACGVRPAFWGDEFGWTSPITLDTAGLVSFRIDASTSAQAEAIILGCEDNPTAFVPPIWTGRTGIPGQDEASFTLNPGNYWIYVGQKASYGADLAPFVPDPHVAVRLEKAP